MIGYHIFLKHLMFILLLALGSLANAAPSASRIGLITPEELTALMATPEGRKSVLILDTRGGYKDYIGGHLPFARHINFDTLRGTDEKGVPVQYLPDQMTKELLSRAGVDKSRQHVLYAEGGNGDEILSTSMVAYVLEKYGIENIKIVDGGLQSYQEKYSLSQEYPVVSKGQLPRKKADVGVNIETVLKKKDQPNVVLIDARPENEYLGQDNVWPRKGHIPGAVSIPWRTVMMENNTHKFRPFSEVQSAFEKAGVTPDKEVIVYCGTSREGSLLRFYLTHLAKYPNVKLYEGSWKEYAALKNLPAETAPNKRTL